MGDRKNRVSWKYKERGLVKAQDCDEINVGYGMLVILCDDHETKVSLARVKSVTFFCHNPEQMKNPKEDQECR